MKLIQISNLNLISLKNVAIYFSEHMYSEPLKQFIIIKTSSLILFNIFIRARVAFNFFMLYSCNKITCNKHLRSKSPFQCYNHNSLHM